MICCLLQEQIIFRLDNKKMMYSERIDWPKIEITVLGSEICCCSSATHHRQEHRRTNYFQARQQEDDAQREARLADQMARQARVRVFVVWLGQIVLRCEIKKILHSERLDWPPIEITMRWSEICLLFTAKLWSDDITRDIINLAHHSQSKLLLFGMVISFAGARSRRC